MAIFIVLWPYLLTTKLRSVIRHNLGHSTSTVTSYIPHACHFNPWLINLINFSANLVLVYLEGYDGAPLVVADLADIIQAKRAWAQHLVLKVDFFRQRYIEAAQDFVRYVTIFGTQSGQTRLKFSPKLLTNCFFKDWIFLRPCFFFDF